MSTEENKKIEGYLQHVGKGFFLDNYELYEKKFKNISDEIVEKIKDKRHTENSRKITLRGGISIFKDNLQKKTLKYISISSSNKIKEKASKILNSLNDNSIEEINYPDDISNKEVFFEGVRKQITVNSFERNTKARQKCIEKYGYNCSICNFNFKDFYGDIGERFIHVHHKKQLSEINKEYKIDPINDLIPVCPNCHAMLHRTTPAYTIDEIKETIKK